MEMLGGGFLWKWIQLKRIIRKLILEIKQGLGKGGWYDVSEILLRSKRVLVIRVLLTLENSDCSRMVTTPLSPLPPSPEIGQPGTCECNLIWKKGLCR